MTKHKALLAIVIGQAVLIVGLLFYRTQRNVEDSPDVSVPASNPQPEQPVPDTLADAMKIAHVGLDHMLANLEDYQGRLIKRELIDGKVLDSEMRIRIQCRQTEGDQVSSPMRVYLKFVKPEDIAGREVIWAEDQNDGKLIAHEAGIANLAYMALEPTSDKAMEGNRYPITEIGLVNLVRQLIRNGDQLTEDQINVTISQGVQELNQECDKIRIELIEPHETLEFKVVEILFDLEKKLPLRCAAYGWPEDPGDPLPLQEEYTYLDLEINVGLDASHFDPKNEEYDFPALQLPTIPLPF